MIFELIKKIIENPNPYTSLDVIKLQVEFFKMQGKLTEAEYDELMGMFATEEAEVIQ